MTTTIAPGRFTRVLPGPVHGALPDGARGRLGGSAALTYPEHSGFDAGSGSFDGLLLRQGKFFSEHAPRDVAGHHEREGNGLVDREAESCAPRRPEDLLELITA